MRLKDMDDVERSRRRRRTLRKDELQKMFEACENDRERALFDVLRATGCRVHEALALRREDIEIDAPLVRFNVTKAKVRPGETEGTEEARETPLNLFDERPADSLRRHLRAVKKGRKVFDITDRAVRDFIKRLARKADVGEAGDIHPHTLRHTAGTTALQLGFDTTEIKHMMGWSPRSKTFETTYAHPTSEGLIEKARKMRGG